MPFEPKEKSTGLGLTMHLSYMACHVTFLIEAYLAQVASKWLLSIVTQNVNLKSGWSVKVTHNALLKACRNLVMAML